VNSWIKFKHEKNEGYKPRGLNGLLMKVKNHSETFGENAVIAVITESIANNYKGIIWDKVKPLDFDKPRRNRFANFKSRERNYEEIERMEREMLIKEYEKNQEGGNA
jgi:hypothetical protein